MKSAAKAKVTDHEISVEVTVIENRPPGFRTRLNRRSVRAWFLIVTPQTFLLKDSKSSMSR